MPDLVVSLLHDPHTISFMSQVLKVYSDPGFGIIMVYILFHTVSSIIVLQVRLMLEMVFFLIKREKQCPLKKNYLRYR